MALDYVVESKELRMNWINGKTYDATYLRMVIDPQSITTETDAELAQAQVDVDASNAKSLADAQQVISEQIKQDRDAEDRLLNAISMADWIIRKGSLFLRMLFLHGGNWTERYEREIRQSCA